MRRCVRTTERFKAKSARSWKLSWKLDDSMTPRQHRTLAHVSAIMAARAWLRPFVRCGAQGRLVCATTMNCGALLSSVSGPRCGVCALRSGLPSCMLTRQRCVVCSRESVVSKFVRTAWLCEMVQCASIPECVVASCASCVRSACVTSCVCCGRAFEARKEHIAGLVFVRWCHRICGLVVCVGPAVPDVLPGHWLRWHDANVHA